MKNLIFVVLICALVTCMGCSEEEMISITSEDTVLKESELEQEDTTEEYNEQMAGNEVISRPFVVYVCGEVVNPGVYELKYGSRVIDAVAAAGGYTEEACDSYLNLAGYVVDEQKIYIPSEEEVESLLNEKQDILLQNQDSEAVKSENSGQSNPTIDLNTASKEELMTLPGIGESKAEKIIAYREENGKFKSTDGIMQISGIKDGLYNKIKDRICVR